jgi:hypothetical protein
MSRFLVRESSFAVLRFRDARQRSHWCTRSPANLIPSRKPIRTLDLRFDHCSVLSGSGSAPPLPRYQAAAEGASALEVANVTRHTDMNVLFGYIRKVNLISDYPTATDSLPLVSSEGM